MADSSQQTTNLDIPTALRSGRGRNLQVVSERQAAPSTDAARAAALAAKEQELQAALATVRTAFGILGSRALVILTSLGAAAAFGWAIYSASGIALLGASVYTTLVFLPALWSDRYPPA